LAYHATLGSTVNGRFKGARSIDGRDACLIVAVGDDPSCGRFTLVGEDGRGAVGALSLLAARDCRDSSLSLANGDDSFPLTSLTSSTLTMSRADTVVEVEFRLPFCEWLRLRRSVAEVCCLCNDLCSCSGGAGAMFNGIAGRVR